MLSKNTKLRWLDLPNHARPFGGQIVIDSLIDHGRDVTEFDGADNDAVILLSLYWCEDLYTWIKFAHRNHIDKRRVIIGGNHATGSPESVMPFCAGAYRGDADEWDGIDESSIWTPSHSASPFVSEAIPQRCITMEAKAVAKDSFVLMELSRGCKYKCHYCQYAWMKPYREQSADWIIEQMKSMSGRCRLASADIPQHTRSAEVEAAAIANGIRIVNQDGALFSVDANREEKLAKMQRFGVDGMSDRLRRFVRKPIKSDWLVDRIAKYSRSGVGRCLAYNLFGLPTETPDDFSEWDATVRRIVKAVEPPFTWVNSWNAFLPMPMTPLEHSPSSWRNDNRDLARMADTRLWAKARGVNVFDMPERTGDRKITARMLAVRATEKSGHIVKTVALDSKWDEWNVLREFRKREGYDLHAGPRNEGTDA